jgi:hypothetical protein
MMTDSGTKVQVDWPSEKMMWVMMTSLSENFGARESVLDSHIPPSVKEEN